MNPQTPARLDLPRGGRAILRAVLAERRKPVWLVGGALRDALAGRSTADLDFVYAGSARALSGRLARRLGGSRIVLDEEKRIYRVVTHLKHRKTAWCLDIAPLHPDGIEADLKSRDFTLNALAWPLGPGPVRGDALLDPCGGVGDIARGRVRHIEAANLDADPLRLLRAYRIAAELGFHVAKKTVAAVRRRAALSDRPAPERRRVELLRLLAAPDAGTRLRELDHARLLVRQIPELEPSRRCARVYYGKGGVLEHTFRVVERLDHLLANLDALYPELAGPIRAEMAAAGATPAHLRLAALLHDVSKPETARNVDGRMRFFGHEARGGKAARAILERLRFSRAETELVARAVHHHLRPGNLASNPVVTPRAMYRFFRDLGPASVPMLLMCWADHASYLTEASLRRIQSAACRGPRPAANGELRFRLPPVVERQKAGGDVPKTRHHLRVVSALLDAYFSLRRRLRPEVLLDGRTLMQEMKIGPGPEVGAALERLRLAQVEGKVTTRAQARALVRTWAARNNS